MRALIETCDRRSKSARWRQRSAISGVLLGSLIALLAACGGDGDDPPDGGDVPMFPPLPESDSTVLAMFEAWERECVRWIRADCRRSAECGIRPSSDCYGDDVQLREDCVDLIGGECESPDPASFSRCRTRTDTETCEEFCDSSFCFSFCFYNCLD